MTSVQKKVLVVGTTPDYIQWIRRSCPDRAVFITDTVLRSAAAEEAPGAHEEILTCLSDPSQVLEQVRQHLDKWNQELAGIFCFDCESMVLAAFLAETFHLPYPSLSAIQNCRDKYVSKQIWQQHGIRCPKIATVNTAAQAIAFFKTTPLGIVLKPLFGSGSELVYKCTSPLECRTAFETINTGLALRTANPLFQKTSSQAFRMLAEELISGTEYSCDFIVENHTIKIIRIAKKIKSPFKPFGTILGYILPASLPGCMDPGEFCQMLLNSAIALGIKRGLCMVDFMVFQDEAVLIEMTPRPGGDCLPHLLKAATGLDMLKISLAFAGRTPVALEPAGSGRPFVAIRIHAEQAGILKKIEYPDLLTDPRVKAVHLTRTPGHRITLPPVDYDSWLLGHVIVEPGEGKFPESEAIAISKKIEICIEND